MLMSGDVTRKRPTPMDQDHIVSTDLASKRSHYGSNSDSVHDYPVNGGSSKVSPLDNGLTPVEQMIAMIGALLAEGERGAESLEILISQIHPDLLADIVVTNMKHLPKNPPSITRLGSHPVTQSSPVPPATQNHVLTSSANSTPLPATASSISLQADSKRDVRRVSLPIFPIFFFFVLFRADNVFMNGSIWGMFYLCQTD